jgi:DNA-binding HxlR family transcriptional regulator
LFFYIINFYFYITNCYSKQVKRYSQACPLARTLDVVGERWSLLVIRELMLGPRRYRDLLDGLPGIGTNVLADRLRALHDHAILTKRVLPPPAAVTVYELTEAGRQLGPSLAALRRWGARYAPPSEPGYAKRPAWALLSATTTSTTAPVAPVPAGTCELRVGPEAFRLTRADTGLIVRGGPADDPDAIITLETETLYSITAGDLTLQDAGERAVIEGDRDIASGFLAALHGTLASPGRSD